MYMCLTDACVWICTCMYACTCRGQRSTSDAISKTLSTLCFEAESPSGIWDSPIGSAHWPESPMDLFIFTPPALRLQACLCADLDAKDWTQVFVLRDRHSTGGPLSSKNASTVAFKIFFQVLLWCCNFHASRDSNQVMTVCLWAAFVHRDYAISSAARCILDPEMLGMRKVHLSMVKFG